MNFWARFPRMYTGGTLNQNFFCDILLQVIIDNTLTVEISFVILPKEVGDYSRWGIIREGGWMNQHVDL